MSAIEQGNLSTAEYYAKLKRIWDELQVLDEVLTCKCGAMDKCTCDLHKKILATDQLKKLIQFLARLNSAYDQVKVNILSMNPLPPVNRAYYILQQVEKQKSMFLPEVQVPKVSALYSQRSNSRYSSGNQSSFQKRDYKRAKDNRFCDHCKRKGHTVDQCFEIIRYPEKFAYMKGKSGGSMTRPVANVVIDANIGNTPLDFDESHDSKGQSGSIGGSLGSQDMISAIYHGMMQKPATGAFSSREFAGSTFTTAGMTNVFNVHSNVDHFDAYSWIIDTGASDNMAFNKSLFISFTTLSSPIQVGIPDGTLKKVTQSGTVQLTTDILIKTVWLLTFIPLIVLFRTFQLTS